MGTATPGLEEVLASDWRKAAMFYARLRLRKLSSSKESFNGGRGPLRRSILREIRARVKRARA